MKLVKQNAGLLRSVRSCRVLGFWGVLGFILALAGTGSYTPLPLGGIGSGLTQIQWPKPPDPCTTIVSGVCTGIKGLADIHTHMFSAYGWRWEGFTFISGEVDKLDRSSTEPALTPAQAMPRDSGLPDHASFRYGILTKLGLVSEAFNAVGKEPLVPFLAALGLGLSDDELTAGDSGIHLTRRNGYAPSHPFRDWPSWDTPAHQQHYWGYLQDAFHKGLRLVFASILEVDPVQVLMLGGESRTPYEVIMQQLKAANTFAQLHFSWVEIAHSPSEARRIIRDGKMAMVLVLEGNFPFCKERPCGIGDDEEDINNINATLDEYFLQGIRGMQLVNIFDNPYGGVAIYHATLHLLQWFYQKLSNDGKITSIEFLDALEQGITGKDDVIREISSVLANLGLTWKEVLEPYFPITGFADINDIHVIAGTIGKISGPQCVESGTTNSINCAKCLADKKECQNVQGLTFLGKQLVQELMDRHMLIDAAHLSEQGVSDLMNIVGTTYPVFISHGHVRAMAREKIAHTEKSTPDWVLINFIKPNGGVFGLRPGADEMKDYYLSGVPISGVWNDCAGSSKSFAQALAYLVDKGLPVAFASDMNGIGVFNLVPRFINATDVEIERRNKRATCRGNKSQQDQQSNFLQDDDVVISTYVHEQDFNYKGLAHIGLVPAVVQDLINNGLNQVYQDALWNSAEKVIQMWEKQ